MIDILDDIQPLIFKIVDRLPRKKDSNTIYIKEMKKLYKEYVWLGGKWHILGKFKKEKKNDMLLCVSRNDCL